MELDESSAWAGVLRDLNERVVQVINTSEDKLDRLASEHNAKDDQLESVLRALSDGLITLDERGICTSANRVASRYLGARADELVGQNILDRFMLSPSHENSPAVFELLWASVRERLALRFEQALLLRADGSRLAVSCVFNPLVSNDRVTGCVFVFRDVSAQRRAEAELRRLNSALVDARDTAIDASKSKSTFLANMSHELRTPLNAIIGYAELVQEDVTDEELPEHIAADVRKIHVAAEHLLHIINDILDVSKIEAGKMELYNETFPLSELIYSVTSTISNLVEKNGNKLVVNVPDFVGSIHADRMKLRQGLLNLMSNAAKFTRNGRVELNISRDFDFAGEWLVFEVVDSGIGIAEDRMEHLFDSFTQADQSTTRQYGGTGLGLTITNQFVQMMGGSLEVASVEGEGSTFTIRLPSRLDGLGAEDTSLAELTSNAEDDYPEIAISEDDGSRSIVLCIDDDENVTDLVSRFLPADEFIVLRAGSGAEGLSLARRFSPSVITLDVMMPGADGWSVLSSLKSDPDLASIPVIMLTIVAERQKGFTLGATDYLTKPIQRKRLRETIRRYCNSVGEVLIVEDDEETRNVLRRTLESQGWRVSEAHHGRQAVELFEDDLVPDLVLLDLMMPEMDGFQVLEFIRSRPELSEVPVLILTAMDLSIQDMQTLHQRATQVLQKGAISPSQLAAKIRSVVGL